MAPARGFPRFVKWERRSPSIAYRVWRLDGRGDHPDWVRATELERTPSCLEDGEWLCSLSRQPNLPIFLDELAEGSHAVLALAVLRAFVAARCRSTATQQVAAPVPLALPRPAYVFCCDNLA